MKNNKKPKIGIDARFYGPSGKGLGRYTQEITDRIIALDSEADYIVFLSEDNFDSFQIVGENCKKIKINIRWYSWQEQFILPFIFLKEKLDLLHFTHFNVPILYNRPFVVTIHDLILTKFPSLKATLLSPVMYYLKNIAYRLVINHAIKQSKAVITVSQFTANDIIQQFKVSPQKVEITYEGVADSFFGNDSQSSQSVLKKYGIEGKYFLYVGNAYPHKNLDGLLKVFLNFQKRHAEKISLVLVGKEDYFYTQIKKIAANLKVENVYFPGYVSDQELISFFSQAIFYVFPSFYEGFGLPPLEAMTRGCPVLSSSQGSLPEILSSAAHYFNPYSSDDFLKNLEEMYENEELRSRLRLAGFERIKMFSWQNCAKQTLDIYKKCLIN
jgi:glycosyltransferase involved in cell wall biosynthesis